MKALVAPFKECLEPAQALAREIGAGCEPVAVHRFPDGESLIQVSGSADTAILYRSLDDPNAKLVELLLAASALRDCGARRIILVAPYLAYMRQDMAFQPGQAVSQKVIGRLIAGHFDGLVTFDAHLHRIGRLEEAISGIPAINLSAAPVLSSAISSEEKPFLIGPDMESRPWVEAIASPHALDVLIGEKQRKGDRDVEIKLPGIERVAGRNVILVDDLISSGVTLIEAARLALTAGSTKVEALATHCLAGPQDLARMTVAGIASIRTAQTVDGPTACLPVDRLIAEAIRKEGWV